METNEGNVPVVIELGDKLNMDRFLEGSTVTRLRNLFEARSDQFYMGFTVNRDTVTRYWPKEYVEQLKLVDPKRFDNNMEDEQIMDKATLKNFISDNNTDWEGIDKVITAMERTREEILKKG